MRTSVLLEIEGLSCGYRRDRPVLSGVDLTVGRGETVVLVGPSGCGKTTLLKTVVGLVPALAGRATALGSGLPSRPMAGSIGYVPQGLGLVRNASVLRNVLMGRMPFHRGWRGALGAFSSEDVVRAMEALELLGLGDRAHARPIHLSGGERRRVAVARALAQSPTLLLADEILSELDERTAETVLDAVRALQQGTGMGVLMVEHDMDRSCDVADVLCCLGAGSVLATLFPGPDRPRLAREVMAQGAPG